MDPPVQTYVKSVGAEGLHFDEVDEIIKEIKDVSVGSYISNIETRRNSMHSLSWIIFTFADPQESRNTLRPIAFNVGPLSDKSSWPAELFSPNSLCYGLYRIDYPFEDEFSPCFVSFCWKGTSLSIYLRMKYTEFNHVIRNHLGAMAHVTLQHPDDLVDTALLKKIPLRKKRNLSRRLITKDIEVGPEVTQVLAEIRSDTCPFNWVVCGYETADDPQPSSRSNSPCAKYLTPVESSVPRSQKLVVIEKGMVSNHNVKDTGLYALKGIGGICAVLKEGCIMYIYLRVDVPLAHGTERIISKYVLITWQTNALPSSTEPFEIDHQLELETMSTTSDDGHSFSLRESISSTTSEPASLQGIANTHVYGREIYRLFPHHVHFYASSISDITEEAVRERVRRALDSDSMLLRVVCIQATGDVQPPICIEVPLDATIAQLRKDISALIGIPKIRQRIVWFRQKDDFQDDLHSNAQAVRLEVDQLLLRKDVGLGHGDKIHVDDKQSGEDSVLARLTQQINAGGASILSMSAERRHEVQRGVEAREAELQKSLLAAHDRIRKRAAHQHASPPIPNAHGPKHPGTTPNVVRVLLKEQLDSTEALHQEQQATSTGLTTVMEVVSAEVTNGDKTHDKPLDEKASEAHQIETSGSETDLEVSDLKQQARVLESQNEYLEIPYESIRILGGKENELGCGKAASVYRGIWMSRHGAAEVAIKLYRYVRLTDKILGDYTQEVAMLRKLKHPNIVLFIGACTNPKLMILMEFCSRKSLYAVIHSAQFKQIPWKFKVRMMLDAARGIQYLHSMRIIHRDIKSHNFLVDDDWRVKVADFGISKVLEQDATAYTQCGTTGWVAPEVLLDEELGYTFKADNWSFAIVMWEMIAGDLSNPFIGMAPIKFYTQTTHHNVRPPVPDQVDQDYLALLTDCWNSNAPDRPSFFLIVSRLEEMLLKLGASIDLPPTFQGGYHSFNSTPPAPLRLEASHEVRAL